jgi:hypothetical protein
VQAESHHRLLTFHGNRLLHTKIHQLMKVPYRRVHRSYPSWSGYRVYKSHRICRGMRGRGRGRHMLDCPSMLCNQRNAIFSPFHTCPSHLANSQLDLVVDEFYEVILGIHTVAALRIILTHTFCECTGVSGGINCWNIHVLFGCNVCTKRSLDRLGCSAGQHRRSRIILGG